MPQFDPSTFPSQIFWLAVTFVAMYFIMARNVLPRIAEVLEERSERLTSDLEKAETLRNEAETVIAAYEEALSKARAEAAAVVAQANQEIAEASAKRQAEFAAELSRRTEAAEARIDRAKEEAKAQVRDIAMDATADLTAKLTGISPKKASVQKAVDGALKEAA
jgi:F-type H+-transporting ATPase subunit b